MAAPSTVVLVSLLAACSAADPASDDSTDEASDEVTDEASDDSVPTMLECMTAPGTGAIDYDVDHTRLTASALVITTPNGTFHEDTSGIVVGESKSDTTATLELEWTERGADMRLYIYVDVDGTDWVVTEIRTYNGDADAEWIYYEGPEIMRCPLGQYARGTLSITGVNDLSQNGTLSITDLSFGSFLTQ